MVSSYQSYAFVPMPYSLAFQWFIYGMIESLILGVVTTLINSPGTAAEAKKPIIF